jgi:hypothetical protein
LTIDSELLSELLEVALTNPAEFEKLFTKVVENYLLKEEIEF